MELTLQSIVTAAALMTACSGIFAVVFRFVRWMDRQKKQDEELRTVREEQGIICYALLACLDGLKQLGANGNVTKAHDALDKHINKAAHKDGR